MAVLVSSTLYHDPNLCNSGQCTSTFTFMTVKRHCAKQVLTYQDMTLHWDADTKVIRDSLS